MSEMIEKAELQQETEPQERQEVAENPEKPEASEKPEKQPGRSYKAWAVVLLRIVVGLLFVFSGFSKLVDPWGFILKLEDYMAALELTEPRTLLLVAAIGLSGFEMMAGFFLMTGCYKRMSPWLLTAFMAVMLPLTLWVWIADPVADCGCFGEALTISNAATFWKNVTLTAALIYLCINNRFYKKDLYRPAIQWLVCVVLMLYSLFIGLYGFNIQPLVDFRPYPVGTDLASLLTADDDDSVDMEFIYEKDGEQKSFSVDNLPDSTWTFVDRKINDSGIVKDGAFAIYDGDENVASDVIASEGEQLIVVIPEAIRADISYTYSANEFNKAIRRDGGSMIGLIAASPEKIAEWTDLSMSDYPYYTVDDTSLKQLARGTMSMVYLRDGIIRWKYTFSTFDFNSVDLVGKGEMKVSDLALDDSFIFKVSTFGTLGFLLILALFQQFILKMWKKPKKEVNLQIKTLQ